MNLVLLHADDLSTPDHAILRDERRCQHILQIQKAQAGDSLKVGLLNGLLGDGKILNIDPSTKSIELSINLVNNPPTPLPLTLVMALPRPKMFRRILQSISSLGIKKIVFINSYRVEKSYWQSPFLQEDEIHRQLTLGLEQACDTQLPEVIFKNRFKPFVEDEIPAIIRNTTALVAHPYTEKKCPIGFNQPLTLAIGPEGGFIPYEIDLLKQQGFEAVQIGERILRVETVLPFLVGRLFG